MFVEFIAFWGVVEVCGIMEFAEVWCCLWGLRRLVEPGGAYGALWCLRSLSHFKEW